MADKVYANGIFGSERSDQKDFVVGKVAIAKDTFMAWLESMEADGKGYVRLNVTRQKADASKWSFSLDTWAKDKAQGDSDDSNRLPF